MGTLWGASCEVIKETIAASGIRPEEIRGVACTGHGKGLYLWGRDGKPAYNGINSTDTRAWEYPARWEKDGTAEKVFAKTYQKILACQPVSLLCWIRDNRPGVLERVRWIFEAKDYIRFRLTGEALAEVTDYSGSNLMNIRDVCFDRELLEDYGLGDMRDALPPLRYSTDPCGAVSAEAAAATGLAAGTPVAGGMFDIDACAVAMDVTDEKNLCVIAGTWGINEYISRAPGARQVHHDELPLLPPGLLPCGGEQPDFGRQQRVVHRAVPRRGEAPRAGTRDRRVPAGGRAGAGVGAEGHSIVFLPYIFGANYNPQAKACFIGLEATTTRAQMIRAVLEGIVFCHMVHVEKLLKSRSRNRPAAVRLAGGAAKSRTWAQIFADVFQLPVEIVDVKEIGALGCAMAAAVASGVYADLKDAAAHMVSISHRLEPDPGVAAVYARSYRRYRAASEALDGIWKDY